MKSYNYIRKNKYFQCLEEILVLGSQASQAEQKIKEFRFPKRKIYTFCGFETILRNCKYNDKQRYNSKY